MSAQEYLEEAKQVSLEAGYVGVSVIQRKLRIGYCTAARVIDLLTEQGFCESEFIPGTGRKRIIALLTQRVPDASHEERMKDVDLLIEMQYANLEMEKASRR